MDMLRASRMDRVGNEDVRRRMAAERKLPQRVDQRVLSWYGHMITMYENCMTKVWRAEVSRVRANNV